jgi:hypothetical protein
MDHSLYKYFPQFEIADQQVQADSEYLPQLFENDVVNRLALASNDPMAFLREFNNGRHTYPA